MSRPKDVSLYKQHFTTTADSVVKAMKQRSKTGHPLFMLRRKTKHVSFWSVLSRSLLKLGRLFRRCPSTKTHCFPCPFQALPPGRVSTCPVCRSALSTRWSGLQPACEKRPKLLGSRGHLTYAPKRFGLFGMQNGKGLIRLPPHSRRKPAHGRVSSL